MDNITLIGLIGSIVSIISLFISIFSSSTKNNFLSSNRNSFNQTLNFNSNNSTTNNFDLRTTINNQTPSPVPSTSSSDIGSTIIFPTIVGLIVIPIYLNHQDITIFYVILIGLIGLLINLLVLFILSKKVILNKIYLCSNILRWFPLFIILIFIYHPIYKSGTLDETIRIAKAGKGLLNLIPSHGYDLIYLALQLVGVFSISMLIVVNVISCIKQLYRTAKKNTLPNTPTWKNFLWYIALVLFLFSVVSGLLIKFFIYIQSLSNV